MRYIGCCYIRACRFYWTCQHRKEAVKNGKTIENSSMMPVNSRYKLYLYTYNTCMQCLLQTSPIIIIIIMYTKRTYFYMHIRFSFIEIIAIATRIYNGSYILYACMHGCMCRNWIVALHSSLCLT